MRHPRRVRRRPPPPPPLKITPALRRELQVFANALRNALDLEPLFRDRDNVYATDERRFYVAPMRCGLFGDSPERTPWRGS